MTAAGESELRLVSFGDLEGRVWGAAFDGAGTAAVVGVGERRIAAGSDTSTLAAGPGEWKLSGPEGLMLSITPRSPAPEANAAALCRVRGRVVVDGAEEAIDCGGVRNRGPVLNPRQVDSLRGVWGWFEDAQALAVVAVRPAGAPGQDSDRIGATVFDAEGRIEVEDSRLSTTYGADGLPARVGLELWIGEGDEQYPRRAVGEAVGPGEELTAGPTALRILPLRCHSADLEGPGVYLLARF